MNTIFSVIRRKSILTFRSVPIHDLDCRNQPNPHRSCENNSTTSTCTNGGAAFISPYSVTLPTPNQNHVLTARIDHRLTKNDDLTVGFQFGRKRNQRQNVESTTRLVEALQGRSYETDAINLTNNHVFSSRAVNQFKFQWSTYLPSYETTNPGNPVIQISYSDPRVSTSSSRTLIAGNSTASNSVNGIYADKRKETRLQFQDSLTYVFEKNVFKSGFDFQHVEFRNLDQENATGT